jgi:hypothetical protein
MPLPFGIVFRRAMASLFLGWQTGVDDDVLPWCCLFDASAAIANWVGGHKFPLEFSIPWIAPCIMLALSPFSLKLQGQTWPLTTGCTSSLKVKRTCNFNKGYRSGLHKKRNITLIKAKNKIEATAAGERSFVT